MISRRRQDVPLWAWPAMLSLDAPVVAVAWLLAFARVFAVPLPAVAAPVLALSVWLVYSADRVLDSFRLAGARRPTLRHAFVAHHRGPLAAAWLPLLVLAVTLAATGLDPSTVSLGVTLSAGAALYLLGVQVEGSGPWAAISRRGQHLQVGLLFAGGVALFAWREVDAAWLLPLLSFALLCALNCAYVARWERALDDGRRPPAAGGAGAERFASGLAAAGLALFAVGANPLFLACALGALTLFVLDRLGRGLEPSLLRLLSELALIAPLAVLLPPAG